MSIQHKQLADGRWAKMSLCEQMANVGSEVSRALNWRKKGNKDLSRKAFVRALGLLDLTISPKRKYSTLKELLRVRENLVDYFCDYHEYKTTETSWRKYFDQFALAARRNR